MPYQAGNHRAILQRTGCAGKTAHRNANADAGPPGDWSRGSL